MPHRRKAKQDEEAEREGEEKEAIRATGLSRATFVVIESFAETAKL